MKSTETETKLRSGVGLTRRLIAGALCLAVISVICTRVSAQNLFVSGSDASGGKIFEFTPSGVKSTFASGVGGLLAFDGAGNLFVADGAAGAIYKFSPDGVRSTFAVGLSFLNALAVDRAGNLFVYDGISGILKFTPNGVRTTLASRLGGPMAVDGAGNLFVAMQGLPDSGPAANTYTIHKFTPNGVRSTFASGHLSETIGFFVGLGVDSSGNVYLVDGGDFYDGGGSAIYKFTPGGHRSTFFGPTPLWSAESCNFGDLAVDSMGNVFVTDNCTGIDKITQDGNRSVFASAIGGSLAFQPNAAPKATELDFNGDGKPDYVLYKAATRQTAIWHLNNNVLVSGVLGPTLPVGWGGGVCGGFQ